MDALRTMDDASPYTKRLILLNYTKSCPWQGRKGKKHQRLNELIAEQSVLQKENASLEGEEKGSKKLILIGYMKNWRNQTKTKN